MKKKTNKTKKNYSADCSWKDPHDVINTMETCSQTEKQKIVCWKTILNYFNKREEMQNSI